MNIYIYINSAEIEQQYQTMIKMLKVDLLIAGHQLYFMDFADADNMQWNEGDEMRSDAYIFTPCGLSANAKFFQHLNLKDADAHDKPLILYNYNGDFDFVVKHMDKWCLEHYMKREDIDKWYVDAKTAKEVLAALN